ncbi:MAG: hypothetical protein GFH27_549287n35 [Chloroflexi bacterium AL-W]|nr:hypothetical protein [Chloroflexi bacterium AL-W]
MTTNECCKRTPIEVLRHCIRAALHGLYAE